MGASGPNVAMRQMEGPGYKHIKQQQEQGDEEEMKSRGASWELENLLPCNVSTK